MPICMITNKLVYNFHPKYLEITVTMARQYSARWAFNTKLWEPTEQEILKATTLMQNEEKERIAKFVFINDAKSSMIGRLMIRKYIQKATKLSNKDVHLNRDSHGKPVLSGREHTGPYFNISHQGDYVVLAGDVVNNVGIDVMKIEPPLNKDIKEFFRLMTRQLSTSEWAKIRSYNTELSQIASFYRFWCLKESYVKNIGVGITVKLSDISFTTKTELSLGNVVNDSVLHDKGYLKADWMFEESLLDTKHVVAAAIQIKEKLDLEANKYVFVKFKDLVEDLEALCDEDVEFKDGFLKKERKLH